MNRERPLVSIRTDRVSSHNNELRIEKSHEFDESKSNWEINKDQELIVNIYLLESLNVF